MTGVWGSRELQERSKQLDRVDRVDNVQGALGCRGTQPKLYHWFVGPFTVLCPWVPDGLATHVVN